MKNPTRLVSLFLAFSAASFAITGCEIIADFDRTKIDAGESAAGDGSTDALPGTDASHDTGADTTLPDASTDASDDTTPATDAGPDAADGSTTDSGADTSTPDAADASQADADDGAADASGE